MGNNNFFEKWKEIMSSDQYTNLPVRARMLLQYCFYLSSFSQDTFTLERKKWLEQFKIYNSDNGQFNKDIKHLEESGFIQKVFCGKQSRKPNVYKLSFEWKQNKVYRKTDFGYIYVIKVLQYYKIGKTINKKRFYEYTKLFEEPQVILCELVDEYSKTEKTLHQKYKNKNVRGEWFELNEEDILEIIKILNTNL